MKKFDEYLPTYKCHVQAIYDGQGTGQPGHVEQRYIPIYNIKYESRGYFNLPENLKKDELTNFSALLFAHNLLSQVIDTYGRRWGDQKILTRYFPLLNTLEKRTTFPEVVKGILGGWGFHVCPSVLPLMYLYMTDGMNISNAMGHQNEALAKDAWITHYYLFEDSITWISGDINKHIKVLCNLDITKEEVDQIKKYLWLEFNRIDHELRLLE